MTPWASVECGNHDSECQRRLGSRRIDWGSAAAVTAKDAQEAGPAVVGLLILA